MSDEHSPTSGRTWFSFLSETEEVQESERRIRKIKCARRKLIPLYRERFLAGRDIWNGAPLPAGKVDFDDDM